MKTRRIEFRATEYEVSTWEALATARGMGLSDLIRLALNAEIAKAGGTIPRAPTPPPTSKPKKK